ncbi:galaxin-2-like isoform X2 [Anguilla rostrata]|uniref:galaxin-2-like isoform X2 n=1 Tax=Anguilla rostrata TaxID=7938 RepID=UPI0030CE0A4E
MGLSAAVFILVAANACFHQVTCAPEDQHNGAPGFNNGICAESWREVCCEDGTVLRPGDPNMRCCGQQTFDPRFSSCCKGHLHQEAGLSCCNGTAYSPLNSTCCLGAVTTGVSEMVSDCCETRAFNPVTQVCCESRIHQRWPDFDCCGKERFNTTTHLCCGKDLDTIVVKPSAHHSCCGKESFNKTTHCCTADTLEILPLNHKNCTTHERPPASVCLNTTTHLCCGKDLDTIIIKPSARHLCCGKESFDKTTHCCTADTLKILPLNDKNCTTHEHASGWFFEIQIQPVKCCPLSQVFITKTKPN